MSGAGPAGQGTISIWKYLTFLLGLVPAAIAVLRLVFAAQGDDSALYVMAGNLNVPALVIATYGRFAGVLGIAATLPLLLNAPAGKDGPRAAALDPPGRAIAWILFACSVACIYPEQIFDYTVISPWPVDIFRAVAWCAGFYLAARGWLSWRRRPRQVKEKRLAGRALARAEGRAVTVIARVLGRRPGTVTAWLRRKAVWIAGHRTEVCVLAPALILLLWSYLLSNDRMWLPAQVVTVAPSAGDTLEGVPLGPAVSGQAAAEKLDPADIDTKRVRLPGGSWAFVAYILQQDSSGYTLMTVRGLLVRVPALDGQVTCQFEPDYDPTYDTPLLLFLPRGRHLPHSANQTCGNWMKALLGDKQAVSGQA
jgi:hypothetical protein